MKVLLGSGSQGKVVKVKSIEDNAEYAMKVVTASVMKDLKAAKQIIQETVLLYTLNHENIIKVKEFFKITGGKFVSVMEYQDSHNFQTIVEDPEEVMSNNEQFAN